MEYKIISIGPRESFEGSLPQIFGVREQLVLVTYPQNEKGVNAIRIVYGTPLRFNLATPDGAQRILTLDKALDLETDTPENKGKAEINLREIAFGYSIIGKQPPPQELREIFREKAKELQRGGFLEKTISAPTTLDFNFEFPPS